MNDEFDILRSAADQLREQFGEAPPVGVVLGSALGSLAEGLEDRQSTPYQRVNGWIPPSVEGHAGELVVGRIGDNRCAMLSGRAHLYEGYTVAEVVRHVRTLRLWGVRILVLTNAAGGIFAGTKPGELMIITDHLNLTGHNPLVGRHDPRISTVRFPDCSQVWNLALIQVLKRSFIHHQIPRREGNYACLVGPTYETPAEVEMLCVLGANAVGMSTVLEALAFHVMPDDAGHAGKVCGVSMLANAAAGRGPKGTVITHEDVSAACRLAAPQLTQVLVSAIPLMAESVAT